MRRRKPTLASPMPADPRFVVHRPSVQQLPPTSPYPRKKIGHPVKYVSPSARQGVTVPIRQRLSLFFGVGGRVGYRK